MDTTPSPLEFVKAQLEAAGNSGASQSFDLDGRTFTVLGKVFSPIQFRSTAIFTRDLQFPIGGSFLEIGCGAGVTAVVAALSGCLRVVATDISPDAVENTRLNVAAHGVADVVDVRQGDLFEPLRPGELFDVIYWNSNFVHVPSDFDYSDEFYRAFFDAGYRSHEQYLEEAPKYLAESGALLLGFSSIGDRQRLNGLCRDRGFSVETLTSQETQTDGVTRRYEILRLERIDH